MVPTVEIMATRGGVVLHCALCGLVTTRWMGQASVTASAIDSATRQHLRHSHGGEGRGDSNLVLIDRLRSALLAVGDLQGKALRQVDKHNWVRYSDEAEREVFHATHNSMALLALTVRLATELASRFEVAEEE